MHPLLETTPHYDRVRDFMVKAKQECPATPVTPSEAVRLLRAKLILEEALETIKKGLGVRVTAHRAGGWSAEVMEEWLGFEIASPYNAVETADGCADVAVVTTGTLIACGIPDGCLQKIVDQNNLDKFGPGHSWREDGKLIKPPGHKPPDVTGLLNSILALTP